MMARLSLAATACALMAAAPATLEVVNATVGALECHAIAAHWYGFDLGAWPAGARRTLSWRYDAASGVASIAGRDGQPIPLEFIYCGESGDAWRTRAILPQWPRLAAPVTCRNTSGALRCEQ